MQKTFLILAAAALLFAANTAHAAPADLYNVRSFDAPVNNECEQGDSEIYDSEDKATVEKCLRKEAIEAAEQRAERRTMLLERGQSVMTIYGFADTCPLWYPTFMSCVIDPYLVAKVL